MKRQCRALLHLSLTMATYSGAQMWHMLQGVGGGLESFSLNVGRGIVGLIAVSDHCQNIRRLSIAARTILGSCSSVWEALGGTLREVSLSSSTLSHFNLGRFGHFCPNVTHLSFRFTEKKPSKLEDHRRSVRGLRGAPTLLIRGVFQRLHARVRRCEARSSPYC